MNEVFFLVEEAIEGGYTAKALGESIFTEGETLEELRTNIKEAVQCHFEENSLLLKLRTLSSIIANVTTYLGIDKEDFLW